MPNFLNPVREKLSAGQPVLGSWVWYTDPCSAEVMAQAGFDWLMIDMEHSYIGPEALRNIVMVIERYDCAPIVRVKVGDIDSIKLSLDTGAAGVIIPQINTAEEARWAVNHTKYAPLGKRGIGAQRASAYGMRWNEYLRNANAQVLTIVQVEDQQAIENLPEILATSGIDGIFIGTFDLSQSMGIIPGASEPRLVETVDTVIAAARRKNLAVGICTTMEEIADVVAKGVTMPTVGADVEFMIEGARTCLAAWKTEAVKV